MVFSGLFFLTVFLPAGLILYYISKNRTYRNIVLTVMSLVFYAWGEPVYILLLLLTSAFVYIVALLIQQKAGTRSSKIYLITGITVIIAILVFFKYSGFIAQNLSAIFKSKKPFNDIALPLGLSFYTFTCISYLADVYKKKTEAQRNFSDLLMYISVFFTVTSGPIRRYPDWVADIRSDRET